MMTDENGKELFEELVKLSDTLQASLARFKLGA